MNKVITQVGLSCLVTIALAALIGPWLAPHSLAEFNLQLALQEPTATHLFGLDEEGRDLLTLVLYGARVSLGISVITVLVTATLGTLVGTLAALQGGRTDEAFIFTTDVLLAFPSLLLVIALAAFQTKTSILQVIAILAAVGWVSYARLVRGQVLALKNRDFIQAARVLGAGPWRLLTRHLLPNLAGPLLVQATFGMAGIIIAESTLSFLGLGVPPEVPSWGRLLDQGVHYLVVAPHLSIFPGLAIMITIIAFNFLGDGLREKLPTSA